MLALVAAVSVATLTVHMWRTARRIKGEIEGQLRQSTARRGAGAGSGVFLFTLLMISREGMETALLMGTLIFQVRALDIITGAVAGTSGRRRASRGSGRATATASTSALFFQVTAIFLLIFVVQLLIYGFHELTEANLFPGSEALHWATEPYGPDGDLRPVPDLHADRRPAGVAAVLDGEGPRVRRPDARSRPDAKLAFADGRASGREG